MTTSKNAEQNNAFGRLSAIEAPQRAEVIDHSIVEDTYELLPSND